MPSHCSSLLCARFRLSSLAVIVALAASGVSAEELGSSPSAAEVDWRPRSELPPEVAERLPVFCEGGYLPGTVGGDGAVVPGVGIDGSAPLEASALNARYELNSELYLQGDVRLRQGPFQATGAEARYDQQSGELRLQGPLVSRGEGFLLTGQEANYSPQ
ncbi:MAG: LPS-assembly protein LptD, partial [Pseudomonadota bacterium]|nr:LPS-assembly protein LptD [Pseudomonadota bacterium]